MEANLKSNSSYDYMDDIFSSYDAQSPNAYAVLVGGPLAPNLRGNVFFYQVNGGVYVCAYIMNIPNLNTSNLSNAFHGLHIHQNTSCDIGNPSNPFEAAGDHYNPSNQPHPMHAGDLPSILANNGIGILCCYTSRFNVSDIIGKALILHENPDDYVTQPSGNSGRRLACGMILPYVNSSGK